MIPISNKYPSLEREDSQIQYEYFLSLNRIKQVRKALLIVPWIGLLGHFVLANNYEDVLCATLAAIGSFFIIFDVFRAERLYKFPLSSLIVLGFGFTLQLGPLLFTLLEGKNITFNLALPLSTFGHSLLASLACLSSHWLYRSSQLLSNIRRSVWIFMKKICIFRQVLTKELIFLGIIGLFALAISSFFSNLTNAQSIARKLINGFQFLSVAPIVLLMPGLINPQKSPIKNSPSFFQLLLFLCFILLTMVIAFARNSRSAFAVPFACLIIAYIFEWLYGRIRVNILSILAIIVSALLVMPILDDLAVAMTLARGLRSRSATNVEVITETLSKLQDKTSLSEKRIMVTTLGLQPGSWSETYLNSSFLSRFTNVKFPDNSLLAASAVSPDPKKRADIQWNQLLRLFAQLPSPVLSLFGMSDEFKSYLQSSSFGDLLYFLSTDDISVLGGLRTGHFFGLGMASFGFFYIPLFAFSLLFVFPLVDAHSSYQSSTSAPPLFSLVAITFFVDWFTFSNSESIVEFIAFPLRGFIQPVILFASVRWMLRCLRLAK